MLFRSEPRYHTQRNKQHLNRFGSLLNNAAIENVSKSTKDTFQALANRLNGNDINKTPGKIAEALEILTAQQDESTLNATTLKDPRQK